MGQKFLVFYSNVRYRIVLAVSGPDKVTENTENPSILDIPSSSATGSIPRAPAVYGVYIHVWGERVMVNSFPKAYY